MSQAIRCFDLNVGCVSLLGSWNASMGAREKCSQLSRKSASEYRHEDRLCEQRCP